MKIVTVVAAVLIDSDDRILLAQRPEGRAMAGLWEFPGGKIEPGETPEVALIRELKEELDVDVSRETLAPLTFVSHEYEGFHLFMPVFSCHKWEGEVKSMESQSITWARLGDLESFDMPAADVPLVNFLKKYMKYVR